MPKNFISNKDETVRMFRNDILESLSRVHPAVPVIIYLPVILYFLYRAITTPYLNIVTPLSLILLGIAVWTLTEYTLHRFIFHYSPKSAAGEKLHFIFHGVHHDYPSDSRRLVMPPSVSIPLASLFYFLFFYLLGATFVAPFFVGFLTGYLIYDMMHYAVHHFNMHNKVLLFIKNHHMKHHYLDASKGYGVSSPLWDEIIGTNFDYKSKAQSSESKI